MLADPKYKPKVTKIENIDMGVYGGLTNFTKTHTTLERHTYAYIYIDRQTDRQMDKKIDRWIDRQKDRQKINPINRRFQKKKWT